MDNLTSQRRLALVVLVMATTGYIGVVIFYANSDYPRVSSDYRYFLPHLLDAYLHYSINGFSIQWYTPSFGGGLPAYPNPQHLQFTLPLLYMILLDPWRAVLASSATFIVIGFLAAYYFLAHILHFNPVSSSLGAILFNVNGFVFSRVVVGHLGYHSFPLLVLLLVALTHPRWPSIVKGAMVGLIAAILLHSGGFYFVVIFGLALWIVVPVLILIKPGLLPVRPLVFTLLWAGMFSLLLTSSKIYAVAAHMREFPRIDLEHYDVNIVFGLASIFLQLFGFTTVFPLYLLLGSSYFRLLSLASWFSGTQNYIWEFDMSMSPALIPLLGAGLFLLRSNLNRIKQHLTWQKLGLILVSVAGVWLAGEFRLTQGVVYPQIQNLPILQSLHVNLRFAAVYILPLAFGGAWIFELAQAHLTEIQAKLIFIMLAGISVASFLCYLVIEPQSYNVYYDVRKAEALYWGIREGDNFPIKAVVANTDPMNSLPLFDNSTDINPYEPVFEYDLKSFAPELHTGSVWDESDGYFNLTNPASLVYATENNSYAFERIRVSDWQQMEDFVNHRQPDWARPPLQGTLDFLMVIGAIVVPILLAGYFIPRTINRLRGISMS